MVKEILSLTKTRSFLMTEVRQMKGGKEMKNNKGMSEVVTTVIFVALALIAIGIVWAVIQGLVQRGASDVTSTEDCLKIDVSPIAASCTGLDCSISLSRKSGGDAIKGVKIVFKDASGASGTVIDYPQNIEALGTVVLDSTDIAELGAVGTTGLPTKVDINSYILDTSGNEFICSQTNTFTVSGVAECTVATQATDCDDTNPATTDTCNAQGLCVNTAA